jgi:hypothetical protein
MKFFSRAHACRYGLVLASLLGLSSVGMAQTSCNYVSPDHKQALLELFTSDGCDSCPPANAMAARLLKEDKSVIPLSYHVTYWNYLGWPDTHSQPAFDERQRTYARLSPRGSVYTPAFFVNGQEWADWSRNRGPLERAKSTTAPVRLSLTLQAASKGASKGASTGAVDVHVRLAPVAGQPAVALDKAQITVLLVQDGVVSQPTEGELNGVTLQHEHVVLATQQLDAQAALQRAVSHRFDLPESGPNERWGVVAFVQSSDLRQVYQSLDAPQCF